MAILTEVLVGIGVSLLAAEVVAYAPAITRWLIKRAVLKLPKKDKERFSEEWLSHADNLPGSIGKLQHGLGCYFKAARSIRRFRAEPDLVRARRFAARVMSVVLWLTLSRIHIPALLSLVLTGKYRSIQAYLMAQRIIVKTIVVETVYRQKTPEEVKAAVAACTKNITEILKPKAGG